MFLFKNKNKKQPEQNIYMSAKSPRTLFIVHVFIDQTTKTPVPSLVVHFCELNFSLMFITQNYSVFTPAPLPSLEKEIHIEN